MTVRPSRRAVLLDLDGVVTGAARPELPVGPHEPGAALRPGVAEQLRRLAGHRVDCAVLTTMCPGRAETLLTATGLSTCVRVVVARAEVPRWMPSALPVTRALQLLGWDGPVDRVALVCDLPEGVGMGRRARLRTVALTGARATAPDLADAWPDVLAASLQDAVGAALDLTDRATWPYARVS